MPDASDFLGHLRELEGQHVVAEIGTRTPDIDGDLPFAKIRGVLGPWRMVDDDDRAGRAVAWVAVGDESGFGWRPIVSRA